MQDKSGSIGNTQLKQRPAVAVFASAAYFLSILIYLAFTELSFGSAKILFRATTSICAAVKLVGSRFPLRDFF